MSDRHSEASVTMIAQRLRWTRQAIGLRQVDWCRQLTVSQQTWNNFERAYSRISLREALKVCDLTGVTLDWIYRGDTRLVPAELLKEICAQQESGGQAKPYRRRCTVARNVTCWA